MKYRNIVLTSLIILTSGLPATSTTDTKNSITDRAITLPAGFKVNPKQMKENWYLNNYTNANQQNVKNSVSGRPASQRDYENRNTRLYDSFSELHSFSLRFSGVRITPATLI
jgi:hypothetical protein